MSYNLKDRCIHQYAIGDAYYARIYIIIYLKIEIEMKNSSQTYEI